ncbi:uncharacterized protein A4U43_C05F14960 [Asparagus officinalis]|uniref:Lipoyl-binding domain-containing protein n=1 Tax=Asparagus officinalis TaxID=4686 RepID=A0A5P1EVF2_ASPOF|nr:uncharacterized protein A4U43_C05F14960 [Asparagus officinalis]
MPALSSTMTEGKIVSWIKSEGDKLSKGESIIVVESDKADMDVETFYDGYLASIMVEEGGVAPVGSAIALLVETEIDGSSCVGVRNEKSSASHDYWIFVVHGFKLEAIMISMGSSRVLECITICSSFNGTALLEIPYDYLKAQTDNVLCVIGHGGSDGLHGYVPSLDHVVADVV